MLCGPCRLGSAPYISRGPLMRPPFVWWESEVLCAHIACPRSGICIHYADSFLFRFFFFFFFSTPTLAARDATLHSVCRLMLSVSPRYGASTQQAQKEKTFFKTRFLLYKMFFYSFHKIHLESSILNKIKIEIFKRQRVDVFFHLRSIAQDVNPVCVHVLRTH